MVSRGATGPVVDRYFELSVLGLVSSGYLAVLGSGYLDAPTAVVTALGLLLRVFMIIGAIRPEIPSRMIAALAIAYVGFYPLDYFFLSRDFVNATVHLVFFLAVMKVLTARATRDYIFLGVIGFLELLAASILSANLTFFIFLAVFLVFGVATFASSEVRRSMRKPRNVARGGLQRFPWRLAALTLTMSFGILALTGGLFFLLPRTAQAAFRHLVPQRFHLPGFSNDMMLGEIGEIQKRQTPVMHVRFLDAHPPGLKWRGVALSHFDGKRWYNPAEPGAILRIKDGLLSLADVEQQRRAGQRLVYEVQLSAISSDFLFFAGRPELVGLNAPALIRTSSDSYRLGGPNIEGLYYRAYSFLENEAAPGQFQNAPIPQSIAQTYLQLPGHLDERIPELAHGVTAGAHTPEARARALERYLQESYRYTTKLLTREVPDPLAHFLFVRRAGHCEYFASSMAVMLRVLGIPSRVATGFQSGIYNPVSGWYVIRASDAHSWVEAYLPGRGWTTFDPTPPAAETPVASLWTRIGFYLDAADTFWQQWVLNYNLDQQLILATRMEDSSRSLGAVWRERLGTTFALWRSQGAAAARRYGFPAVIVLMLAVAGWLGGPKALGWWRSAARVRQVRRGQACSSDATLLYNRMLGVMHRRGFEKPTWITPSEFARVMPRSETAVLVDRFTVAYNDLRFGGNPEAATRMIALLDEIERTPRE